MGEAKQRSEQGRDFKLDGKITAKIVQAAGDTARAVVQSPQFQQALVRNMIREAATNPGGFSRRPLNTVTNKDFLVAPQALDDGSVLVLTMFPLESDLCYTVLVSPKQHDHDHTHDELPVHVVKLPTEVTDGPTPVDEHDHDHTSPLDEVLNYSVIAYRDMPGNACANHAVELLPEEAVELDRQLTHLNVGGMKWFYITKLEIKNEPAQ